MKHKSGVRRQESGDSTDKNTQYLDVRTVVRVTALDNFTTRREELATLAGGKSVNEAISFAESLLTQAADRRQAQQNGSRFNKTNSSKPN